MATVPVPNSSTGGYLVPDTASADPPAPLYDNALEDFLHDVIQGICGIADPKLVRPAFQPNPPNQPAFDVNWVAFRVMDSEKDFDAFKQHDPDYYTDGGATITEQDEVFTLLVSFFGPNSHAMQSTWEDGIKLSQNREVLDAAGIKFMGHSRALQVPALQQEQWLKRWDQRVYLRRRVKRVYPILNIASASVRYLDNEKYLTEITVNPPTP